MGLCKEKKSVMWFLMIFCYIHSFTFVNKKCVPFQFTADMSPLCLNFIAIEGNGMQLQPSFLCGNLLVLSYLNTNRTVIISLKVCLWVLFQNICSWKILILLKNNFWDCNIITSYPFPFHPQISHTAILALFFIVCVFLNT